MKNRKVLDQVLNNNLMNVKALNTWAAGVVHVIRIPVIIDDYNAHKLYVHALAL